MGMTRLTRAVATLCICSAAAFSQTLQPPALTKAFVAATIPAGGATNLNFSITNPNTVDLSGISFSDTLPAGLTYASPGNYSFCGGTVVLTATVFTLSNGSVAASGNCAGGVTVTGETAGVKNNATSTITATGVSAGAAATASLTVIAAPTITKSFGPTVAVPLNRAIPLTFTISNPNSTSTLTGVGFTDNLPAEFQVANPNFAGNTCGGTLTSTPGSGTITLANGTIAASASCAVTVAVFGAAEGQADNVSGAVTSANGGTGNTASASIFVGDAFQVRYASNIRPAGSTTIPDSVINITNAGGSGGVTNLSGTAATVGGSLCVNVYGFSADEQMVACCSCPVTPGGLVSLSVANDIATNTLTARRPTSAVIKLLATAPVGGSCTGSASAVSATSLVPGLAAWGTTAHSGSWHGSVGNYRDFVQS